MSGSRILIVDDEPQVLEGLHRTLRHEGYELLSTTSPLEALRILERGGVDILISDIDMPEMTGLELVARARASHPDVIRMLLTGDASLESALRAINDGAVTKYLTKPWRAQDLREALRLGLAGLAAHRRQASSNQVVEADERRRDDLERQYPDLTAVNRVDGAYLLNDMRVVESLVALGEGGALFEASRWLPVGVDMTADLKAR